MREFLAILNDARDSTRAKDSWGVNCFTDLEEKESEDGQGKVLVVKRPGLQDAIPGLPDGFAQGLFNFEGFPWTVIDDVLYGPCGLCEIWRSSTSYLTGDIVCYSGSSYEATAPSTGIEPPNAGYWTVVTAGQTWVQITTTLPCFIGAGLRSTNLAFEVSGNCELFDGATGMASTPLYTSADLVSWTGSGVYPSNYDGTVTYALARLSGNYVFLFGDSSGEIWMAKSADCVTWTQTNISADLLPPGLFANSSSAELGGVLYILSTEADSVNWITTTTNGLHTSVCTVTDLPNGTRRIVAFGGYLYAIPYNPASISTNYVYRSSNGINWTAIGPMWGSKPTFSGVGVFPGKVYVCGGFFGARSNAVYSTSDFLTWTTEVYVTNFTADYVPVVLSMLGKLTLIGGSFSQDVWYATTSSGSVITSHPL